MLIFDRPALLRQQIRLFRQQGMSIALVPTMGNLHNGHIKIVELARQQAEVVVVSIFVNPLQFERQQDLACYPASLQQDCEKLSPCGVDLVFAPQVSDFYPGGITQHSLVDVPALSSELEGANCPGYFRGITTVLCKLFNLVTPDTACFGEKDYQQLAIVRRLVVDLNFDIEIISLPTVRDEQGLALSSCNQRLTEQQRHIAPAMYWLMRQIAQQLTSGQADVTALCQQGALQLQARGFHDVELYIRDATTLAPLAADSQQAVILLTGWLGDIRLIDNLVQPLSLVDI